MTLVMGFTLVILLWTAIALLPVWPTGGERGYAPSALTGALLLALVGLIRLSVLV